MTTQETKPKGSYRGAIIAILVVCLCLRLAVAFYYGDAEVRADAAAYKLIAENIADGKGFISNDTAGGALEKPHPSAHGYVFYPYFLALLMWSCDASHLTVSIVQSFIDTLTCLLVFGLALRVTSRRRVAIAAALAYALYPPSIKSVSEMMTETTTTLILVGAIYLLVGAFEKGKWRFALAGAAMGLLILAKPAMLAFPICVAVLIFASRRAVTAWLPKAALYVLAAYLIVSPWTIRNYLVLHAFVPVTTNLGMVLWQGSGPYDGMCPGGPGYPVDTASRNIYDHPEIPDVSERTFQRVTKMQEEISGVSEVRRDAILKREAIREIKEHPGRWLLLAVKKPVRLWLNVWTDHAPSMLTLAIALINAILLALAAVAYRGSSAERCFSQVALLMCAYITLTAMVTYATGRYSYPYVPFVIILAASLIGARKKQAT